jgi:hypothetical protein
MFTLTGMLSPTLMTAVSSHLSVGELIQIY